LLEIIKRLFYTEGLLQLKYRHNGIFSTKDSRELFGKQSAYGSNKDPFSRL
jgi:hypothetical protein